jgi:hypothetical protein
LVSVTAWAALEPPIAIDPKSSETGETPTGASPVPDKVTLAKEPLLSCPWIVPSCFGANLTSIVHDVFGAREEGQ